MSFLVMKKLLGIDSWATSLPFDILIVLVDCFLGHLQLRELLSVGLVVVLAHPPRYCGDQLPGLRVPAILGQPPPDGARVEDLAPVTISPVFPLTRGRQSGPTPSPASQEHRSRPGGFATEPILRTLNPRAWPSSPSASLVGRPTVSTHLVLAQQVRRALKHPGEDGMAVRHVHLPAVLKGHLPDSDLVLYGSDPAHHWTHSIPPNSPPR